MRQCPLDTDIEASLARLSSPREAWSTTADVLELVSSIACSAVTTSYVIHHEAVYHVEFALPEWLQSLVVVKYLRSMSPPSMASMVLCCLLLGCAASSNLFRRHRQDVCQPLVFAAVIAPVVMFGFGHGCSVDVILLCYLPWAICAAMLVSTMGHALVRSRRLRIHVPSDLVVVDEKAKLLA